MSANIFVKHTESTENTTNTINILSKQEILNSIPSDCTKIPNTKLDKSNIEWRWRFLKIPNKTNEVVEISYKLPNEKRKYINSVGEWVSRDIGSEFDGFVIMEYYHYTVTFDKNHGSC